MIFDTILDIINLTAVKEFIAEKGEERNEVLKIAAIGGMSLVGAPLLLLAILLYFCKNIKGKYINKIRNYLFYKLLIQYFKVAFIALLLDHLFTVTQSSDTEVILKSSGVLTGVAAILLLFLAILTYRDRLYLEQNRPQIGALYQNLQTTTHGRFYGFFWFVQRVGLVLSLVIVRPFFFQFALTTFWLLMKPLWFVHKMPYLSLEHGLSDFLNDLFLLFTHACMATWLTSNVPDDETRYAFGWKYSVLIATMFTLNALYVIQDLLKSAFQAWKKKQRTKRRKELREAMNKKRNQRQLAAQDKQRENEEKADLLYYEQQNFLQGRHYSVYTGTD